MFQQDSYIHISIGITVRNQHTMVSGRHLARFKYIDQSLTAKATQVPRTWNCLKLVSLDRLRRLHLATRKGRQLLHVIRGFQDECPNVGDITKEDDPEMGIIYI